MGYDLGTIVVKLGSETPITSMDRSGTVLWAKNNEIQTVSLRGSGAHAAGGERFDLMPKELGSCENYTHRLLHNSNGRFVAVCGTKSTSSTPPGAVQQRL